MKKILLISLLLSAVVLPSFAQDCSRYKQFAPKQQLLFYIQDNNSKCIQELLDNGAEIYWKTEDMCVDLLFYWVHKGFQDTYENVVDMLISNGADMTQIYCRQSAIGAAVDLAIADINKKNQYDENSFPIKKLKYLLIVGKQDNVVNKVFPNLLQYSIDKTGRITSRFVELLLDYGISVNQEDINYAYNNGYGDIYDKLVAFQNNKK